MKKIAVLIPCYNESISIKKVVNDFQESIPEADIYVYDNNSSDGTDAIAKKEGAIVRYEKNQGKGCVVRKMFSDIDADCYIMVDGDDTYPASAAKSLASKILNENYDMAIGDRLSSTYYEENTLPFHGFGNKLVKFVVNTLYEKDIPDVMTGYRAFSKKFVKSFWSISNGFETETEMTIFAIREKMRITSIVIQYKDRPKGSKSKINTLSDGIKILMSILKFSFKKLEVVHE